MLKRKSRPLWNGCLSLLFLALFVSVLMHTATMNAALRHSVRLCLSVIVPSLFPFLILTDAMTETAIGRRILSTLAKPFAACFGISALGASAYLVGLLFGYPLGIQTISAYVNEGRLDKREAERLVLFCNNTGPAFLIGAIGELTGSRRLGIFLYLAECLVTLLLGVFICRLGRPFRTCGEIAPAHQKDFCLSHSITRSAERMLGICGCILFFSAVGSLLPHLQSIGSQAILLSLLEIGGATAYIAEHMSGIGALPYLGFAITFSGLSVWMQAKALLVDTHLNTKWYLPVKLISGCLCFLLLLCPVFH